LQQIYKKDVFIKLRNGIYILAFKWKSYITEGLFEISAFLRVPSYISLATALSYYEITTCDIYTVIESLTDGHIPCPYLIPDLIEFPLVGYDVVVSHCPSCLYVKILVKRIPRGSAPDMRHNHMIRAHT